MKIKISHKPEEQKEAAATVAALLRIHPGATVRKSDRHAPFLHVYLTTKKLDTPCESGGSGKEAPCG